MWRNLFLLFITRTFQGENYKIFDSHKDISFSVEIFWFCVSTRAHVKLEKLKN